MKLATMNDLLEDQLKDLYSAETQLLKAMPKMIEKASSPALIEALESHARETEMQIGRLEKIQTLMECTLKGKKCKAMEGLIEEGSEALEATGPENLVDLLIVAAAQRIEHYEISAYGTAAAIADQLGEEEVAELLRETLQEESAADEKLTAVSYSDLFSSTAEPEEDSDEDESDEEGLEDQDVETEEGEDEASARRGSRELRSR